MVNEIKTVKQLNHDRLLNLRKLLVEEQASKSCSALYVHDLKQSIAWLEKHND